MTNNQINIEPDALAESEAEEAALDAVHAGYVNGDEVTTASTTDPEKPRPVPLAEMQAKGGTLIVGDKTYKVGDLLFGQLAEVQSLLGKLPLVLYAAVLAEPSDGTAAPYAVDKDNLVELMRKMSENSDYSAGEAKRDMRRLSLVMGKDDQTAVATIILFGIAEQHPDATAADFLPYLSVPASITAIRCVLGGATADFFAV